MDCRAIGGSNQLDYSWGEKAHRFQHDRYVCVPDPEDAIDLLQRLIQYEPDKRLSAADALHHNYCQQFYDSSTTEHDMAKCKVSTQGFPVRACRARPARAHSPRWLTERAPPGISQDNEKQHVNMYRSKLYTMIEHQQERAKAKDERPTRSAPESRRQKNRSARSKR